MIKKLWPSIGWGLFVLLLTGMPGNYVPSVLSFLDWASPDKIVHFVLFGGQSFLFLYGFRHEYIQGKNRKLIIAIAIGFSIFYGMLTEIMQNYVFIGRNGNLYDFYADTLGAILGFLAFYLLIRKKTLLTKIDTD